MSEAERSAPHSVAPRSGWAEAPPDLAFTILAGIFVGGLVIAAVLAAKLVAVGPLSVPAGVLAYALTFACTDIIAERYGRARAHQVVLAGLVALIVCFALIQLALLWPAAAIPQDVPAFESVLSSSARIIVASLLAYVISQNADVYIFARLRRATGGRHLWLRNNVSTMLAQLLDSAIFITIAFLGAFPILPVIFGQWLVKLAIAAVDTPVVYLAVALLRRPQPA